MTDLSDPQMGELINKPLDTTNYGKTLRGTLEHWTGDAGNDYTQRNAPTLTQIEMRKQMWSRILSHMTAKPYSFVEVGANMGQNLSALRLLYPAPRDADLVAVEPNELARKMLMKNYIADHVIAATADAIPLPDDYADCVFTSGVLIHIHPDKLHQSCKEIVRIARKYVVAIEYFSSDPESKTYRGQAGLLWKRDFGRFYQTQFNLKPIYCGFEWAGLTGLDNLTWWVMEKV